MDNEGPNLDEIGRRFEAVPGGLGRIYRRALIEMKTILPTEDLVDWARHGLQLTSHAESSFNAASEYFQASPATGQVIAEVIKSHGGSFFPAQARIAFELTAWADSGVRLYKDSPDLAAAYFRASPLCVQRVEGRRLPAWSDLGRQLHNGKTRSIPLARRFFQASPLLLAALTYSELEHFNSLLLRLKRRSYNPTMECLELAEKWLPAMETGRAGLLSLLSTVVDKEWKDLNSCFEPAVRALPRIEQGQRDRFLALSERASRGGYRGMSQFLTDGSRAMGQIPSGLHGMILNLGEALIQLYPPAFPAFILTVPSVLDEISSQQLEVWFSTGIRVLREDRANGLSYFCRESQYSQETMETLSATVEFSKVRELLRVYCRALAGSGMEVAPTQELVEKGIGWVSLERPTVEGSTVYLPPRVGRYGSARDNFGLYKVVATHQVAHVEYGSFKFQYDVPSTQFQDLRPLLNPSKAPLSNDVSSGQLTQADNGVETAWLTDMHRFFALFDDGKLALDIFTVIEDGRLDVRVEKEYAGIRSQYRRVQSDSLQERPDIQSLPAKEAMVEFLVRLSLRQDRSIRVPTDLIAQARRLTRIVTRVLVPNASVEDVAEATLRSYAIISKIPNVDVPLTDWEELEIPDSFDDSLDVDEDEDLAETLNQEFSDKQAENSDQVEEDSVGEMPTTPEEDDLVQEKPYNSSAGVEYRGDFKPGLVQLLNKLRESREADADTQKTMAINKEELSKLLEESNELQRTSRGSSSQSMGAFANNFMLKVGLSVSPPPLGIGQGPFPHMEEEGGPLEASEPNTFVYDEWDFRADEYRQNWCMVRDKDMPAGDVNFWNRTLRENIDLVNQIRRQFEMAIPESFRKLRPLADGEDLDFDAVISSMVDLRIGGSPSEKIYWRRNKIERDVAVLFLLDMSASTAEAIDETRRDDWGAPSDPVDYMLWLRNRRGESTGRSYKRIIDLEKESLVLLIQALEALGDQYGIYGFSGYGRENVEFYVIKALQEVQSEIVRKRIDKISPLHATRMGPAIRHATTRLSQVEAKTKFLFLISDGRPQDRGYSREGVEKEYAIQDTHMALVESKRHNITPFCLTVDKTGHDYLKAMCGDMGYEVLADIQSLPQRLPELYKRLTF